MSQCIAERHLVAVRWHLEAQHTRDIDWPRGARLVLDTTKVGLDFVVVDSDFGLRRKCYVLDPSVVRSTEDQDPVVSVRDAS